MITNGSKNTVYCSLLLFRSFLFDYRVALFAAYLPVEHKNMNCKEEHKCDGNGTVKDQDNWKLIQDHTEQAAGEGNHNCSQ